MNWAYIVLYPFEPLILAAFHLCKSCWFSLVTVQACGLPRQLGQWVRKSSSQQSLSQWPAARIYCTRPLTTHWNSVLSEKRFMFTKNRRWKKHTTGQEERPKNNNERLATRDLASIENQVPEASEGHGLQSSVCSFTARSLICQALW